ncbi:MAG: molybdate ABC transporter substrate-binding protein [Gammaproteobacteria bacterium]|nr:molybdate ABC transporter substrate-binding protein [Gammaproteobacteria bacterium]
MPRHVVALFASIFLALPCSALAQKFTVAAAADLRYALDDIAVLFRDAHPDHTFNIVYGSSGKMTTQIMNGAPYDVFFSADIAFPKRLQAAGLTATEPTVYAIGRIVVWSTVMDASSLSLQDLATDARIRRIAIAQPTHAPYGMRAQEALVSAGLWAAVEPKLVFGENIAHTAQMVESGAAEVGIIALSLALFPRLAEHPHRLIDDALHQPLTQGYVVTQRAAGNSAAVRFAQFMRTEPALEIMHRYGFVLPR